MFKRRWKLALVSGAMAALSFGGSMAATADATPPPIHRAAHPGERLSLDIGVHIALENAFGEPDEALDHRRAR